MAGYTARYFHVGAVQVLVMRVTAIPQYGRRGLSLKPLKKPVFNAVVTLPTTQTYGSGKTAALAVHQAIEQIRAKGKENMPPEEMIREQARKMLALNPEAYFEPGTNRLNLTGFAEEIQNHFSDQEDVEEIYFEVAFEVAEEFDLLD